MSSRSDPLGSWVMTIIQPKTAQFMTAEKTPSYMGHTGAGGTMLPSHNGAYTRRGAETDRIGDLVRIGLGGLRSFDGLTAARCPICRGPLASLSDYFLMACAVDC